MKKVISIILLICASSFSNHIYSQFVGINYQAVAIDENGKEIAGVDIHGNPIQNAVIAVRFSILQGSASGTLEYQETHETNTDYYGMFSLVIGQGQNTGLGVFTSLDEIGWNSTNHFLKVELDIKQSGDYRIITNQPFSAVPYAYYSLNSNHQDLSSYVTYIDFSDSLAQLRNEIPDATVFLTHETDPEFLNSQAFNINSTDIINLSNLSGINTGDQDLSFLATITSLGDSIELIRNEIPDVTGLLSTEVDPVFENSLAANITISDTTLWNNKQSQLVAGSNISIVGDTISASYGALSPGTFNHYIGELFGGGIVVAVWKENGIERGLIASLSDLSISSQYSSIINSQIGPSAQSLTDGQANTASIVAHGDTSGAAFICHIYTAGGYNDWYLPAAWELVQCYNSAYIINSVLGSLDGFQNDYYWSSSEIHNNGARYLSFDLGSSYNDLKYHLFRVRAIRKF